MYVPFSCKQLELKQELYFASLFLLCPELKSEYDFTQYNNVEWIDYSSDMFEYEKLNDYLEKIKELDVYNKSNDELKLIINEACTELAQNSPSEFDFVKYGQGYIDYVEALKTYEAAVFDKVSVEENEKLRLNDFIIEIESIKYLIVLM